MDRIGFALALAALVGFGLAGISSAHAQDNGAITELSRCQEIGREDERLACFDRASDALLRGQPQTPPAPAAQNFGKAQAPKDNSMTAGIAKFDKDGQGRFTVALQNGQVWRQVAGDTGVAQFHSGRTQSVTITRGSLGSYDLHFNDRNATFKVQRQR